MASDGKMTVLHAALAAFGGAVGVLLVRAVVGKGKPARGTVPSSVLLIGDSFAEGLSPPLGSLAEANGISFVGRGVRGATIRYWLTGSSVADAVGGKAPSLAIVSLGTNDIVNASNAADAAAQGHLAGALIDAVRKAGAASVAWVGPPSLPADKDAFRSALEAECGRRSVQIFDSREVDLPRAKDRIHSTPAGYREWAEKIAAWVPFAASTRRGGAKPTARVELRDRFFVDGLGEVDLDDYVARVVTGEVGAFHEIEALKAQAIAARTFVGRALRDDPKLGTSSRPVPNGEMFQVAARAAKELPARAARETHGGVAVHDGRIILGNYVAGAPWASGASSGVKSPDHPTERFVTYNAGLSGADVHRTTLSSVDHRDNRGCMSQNGAQALAARGWRWPEILRFFYGEDVAFTILEDDDRVA